MDSLPTEIITHILQFLDPVEIQRASEVSFSWYRASMHPGLVKDIFMGRKRRCNFAKVTFSQYKSESKSLDLMIEGHNRDKDLTWDNNNAQLGLGQEVEQLLLKIDKWISPYLTAIILNDILGHFNQIEILVLKDMNMHRGFLVDGSLSVHLQSLQRLQLCFVGNILNFLQGPTVDLLPKRIHLCLENEVVLTGVKENSQRNYARVISTTLTLEDLKILCVKYPSIFTELNMVNSALTQEYTEKLCRIINMQMETLKLAKCNFIDDKALEILSNSTLRLKTLVVDGCKPNYYDTSYITTSGIEVVAHKMKSLENLSFYLRDKVRLTPDIFSSGFIDQLTSLSLMSYGEHNEYCTINLQRRQFTAAHLCKLDSPMLLKSLSNGSPMLQELSLDLICEISNCDVLYICKVFPNISVLKLNSVCEVTDKAMVGSEYFKLDNRNLLVDLHISEDNQGDNNDHKHRDQRPQSAQPFIEENDISTSEEETRSSNGMDLSDEVTKPWNETDNKDSILIGIIDSCGSSADAASLNLSLASSSTHSNMSDDSYLAGHRGLRELVNLQTLNLVGCCELTDKGFAIGVTFHNLTHLKLTHCDNLTDSGTRAIVTNNPTIKTFILEFCRMLSDDSVRRVVDGLKNLEKVKFDNCSKLTAACLMYVTLSNTLQDAWFGSCNIPIVDIDKFKESTTTVKYHDFDW